MTNFISFYNDCMLSTSFFRFTKLLKDFIKFFRKHLGMHPFLVAVGDVKKENYWNLFTVSSKSNRSVPSRHLFVQSQQQNPQHNMWNLFKVNNEETKTTSFDIYLVFSLLTLNRSHTLFCWFYCWFWTSECRLRNSNVARS